MSRVLVPLAEGFEELEAITVIDLLRRAGVEVVVAGLAAGPVTGSHGISVVPDTDLDSALEGQFDMVALPGGMPGSARLAADARLLALLRQQAKSGRHTAAICAAPSVLARAGVLSGKRATSYPGFLDADNAPDTTIVDEAVVTDGRVVTSRGPGTAMDFALALIKCLEGETAREAVETRLLRTHQARG